jgi:hypothetical protein
MNKAQKLRYVLEGVKLRASDIALEKEITWEQRYFTKASVRLQLTSKWNENLVTES